MEAKSEKLKHKDGEEQETYYDAIKREMAGRAARSRAALDGMDPEQRIAMEGYRPGTYLRLHFKGMKTLIEVHACDIKHLAQSICSTRRISVVPCRKSMHASTK